MSLVRCEVADGVAVVTLDDPERRNALNLEMVDEIVATFDTLEADDNVGAVVVTGAPPAFCAGADLGHLGGSQRDGLRSVYEGFLRVGRSPLPTLAAVNGAAAGGGLSLALAARDAQINTLQHRDVEHPLVEGFDQPGAAQDVFFFFGRRHS